MLKGLKRCGKLAKDVIRFTNFGDWNLFRVMGENSGTKFVAATITLLPNIDIICVNLQWINKCVVNGQTHHLWDLYKGNIRRLRCTACETRHATYRYVTCGYKKTSVISIYPRNLLRLVHFDQTHGVTVTQCRSKCHVWQKCDKSGSSNDRHRQGALHRGAVQSALPTVSGVWPPV